MNDKGVNQTTRMHRLVCAFVVSKQQSQGFSHQGPYDVEAQASWPPPAYKLESYALYGKQIKMLLIYLYVFAEQWTLW